MSPLRFGVGMCENYAAALTLLLREMGLEAEYIPGLTCSISGTFTSDESGVCFIEGLKEGCYVVTEIKGLSAHKGDPLSRNVYVETGKLNKEVFVNYEHPIPHPGRGICSVNQRKELCQRSVLCAAVAVSAYFTACKI